MNRPTVQLEEPYLLVRGQDTVIAASLHQNGGAVLVSTATVTLYDADGDLVGTYTDLATRTPRVTIPAAAVPSTVDFSEAWRVEWDFDGVKAYGAAYVVRRPWLPAVTDIDLFRRQPALDPSGSAPVSDRDSYEPERLEAGNVIRARLLQAGRRPWMFSEPHALREPLVLLSLALIFESFIVRESPSTFRGQFSELADRYRAQFEGAMGSVVSTYDEDQDGERDSSERISATGPQWLM